MASRDALLKLTATELKAKCKAAGTKCSGTKAELVSFLLDPATHAKRASAGGARSPAKKPRPPSPRPPPPSAAAGGEEARLVAALARRAPSRKEIESTEAGGAPTVVERTLPSFFDFYPRAKRAHEALKNAPAAKRLALLRACDAVLKTGDAIAMGALVGEALAGDPGDASAPIDVDDDEAVADASFRWQVDGGDAGWLDFDPGSNAVAETARKAKATEATFTSPYGSYVLKLDFMVQVNRQTGTARPVRFVP